jgi:HEAT repeat protein
MSELVQRDVTAKLLWLVFVTALLIPNCHAADDSRDQSRSLESHIGQLKAADPKDRRSAADAIAAIGPNAEPAIPSLADALRDPDVSVRNAAANALVNIGPKATSALAATLKCKDPSARAVALGALHRLSPACMDAIPALIDTLKDDDVEIRVQVASVLGQFGADAKVALPALREATNDRSNLGKVLPGLGRTMPFGTKSVQEAAVRAIRQIDPAALGSLAQEMLPGLREMLKDKDDFVQQSAVSCLDAFGPLAEPALPELTELLKDRAPAIRSEVYSVLWKIGEKGVAVLLTVVRDNQLDREGRLSIISGLKGVYQANPATIQTLTDLLQDRDRAIQAAAAECLGSYGPKAKKSIPALAKALRDPASAKPGSTKDEDVPGAAAAALSEIGTDAVPTLIEALQDEQPRVRWLAARAVGKLRKQAKAAIPVLEKNLNDKLAAVALESACALILVNADTRKPMLVLLACLKHPAAPLRWQAADAVERIGPQAKDAVPALKAMLKDSDKQLPPKAILALTKLGPEAKGAVPDLATMAKESKSPLRQQAVEALGAIGPEAKDSVPDLIDLLSDKEVFFRLAVIRALGDIGMNAKPSIPRLIEVLQEKSASESKQRPKSDPPMFVMVPGQSVAGAVADALGKMGPAAKEAIPVLIAHLRQSKDGRREVMAALGHMGPEAKAAVPLLTEELFAPVPLDGTTAANALGRIGSDAKEAVPALEKATHAQHREVRAAAAAPLIRITGNSEKYVPVIVAVYRDNSVVGLAVSGKGLALDALEFGGDSTLKPAFPILVETLEITDAPGWRIRAAEMLAKIGTESAPAVPQLTAMLHTPKTDWSRAQLCASAAKALGRIGPAAQAAAPDLLRVSQDDDEEVARIAADALSKIRANSPTK